MGRIQDFGADAVGSHLGDALVLVLGAAGRVVGPLPAKIGGAILKSLRQLFLPKTRGLDDMGVRRDQEFIDNRVSLFTIGSFNNSHRLPPLFCETCFVKRARAGSRGFLKNSLTALLNGITHSGVKAQGVGSKRRY